MIRIAITQANTGRSMKNCGIVGPSDQCAPERTAAGAARDAFGCGACAATAFAGAPGRAFCSAGDDDLVSVREPSVITQRLSCALAICTRFCATLPSAPSDQHVGTGAIALHRELRHQECRG